MQSPRYVALLFAAFITVPSSAWAICITPGPSGTCNGPRDNSDAANLSAGTNLMNGDSSNTGSKWNQNGIKFGNFTFSMGVTQSSPWNNPQTQFGSGFGPVDGPNSRGLPPNLNQNYSTFTGSPYFCAPNTAC